MRKPRPGEGRKLPKVPSQVLQWHSASSLLRIVVPHFLPSHQMELFVAPQTWFLRAFSFHMKQELILESQIHSRGHHNFTLPLPARGLQAASFGTLSLK